MLWSSVFHAGARAPPTSFLHCAAHGAYTGNALATESNELERSGACTLGENRIRNAQVTNGYGNSKSRCVLLEIVPSRPFCARSNASSNSQAAASCDEQIVRHVPRRSKRIIERTTGMLDSSVPRIPRSKHGLLSQVTKLVPADRKTEPAKCITNPLVRAEEPNKGTIHHELVVPQNPACRHAIIVLAGSVAQPAVEAHTRGHRTGKTQLNAS
jgi:hypothetical protein